MVALSMISWALLSASYLGPFSSLSRWKSTLKVAKWGDVVENGTYNGFARPDKCLCRKEPA